MGLLYVCTFIVHVGICYYMYMHGVPLFAQDLAAWVSGVYVRIGFDWSSEASSLIAAAALSGLSLNVVRVFVEGIVNARLQFRDHTKRTKQYLFARALVFVAFVVAALGAFGDLNSNRAASSLVGMLYVSVGTYLFGLVVNVMTDAVSALFTKRNREINE